MLRPHDIAVLLSLIARPHESYGRLAALLRIGKSTAHAAVARLERSGLVHRVGREGVEVAAGPALEFLQFGAAYAYQAEMSPRALGVPTGFAAPSLRSLSFAEQPPVVWRSRLGDTVGAGIKPLIPAAAEIALRDPLLYHVLALFDALRLADVREREIVREELQSLFGPRKR